MTSDPASSTPDERDEPVDDGSDARNRSDEDYDSMPGTFVDTAQNMPGDQPTDTPPPKTKAERDPDRPD